MFFTFGAGIASGIYVADAADGAACPKSMMRSEWLRGLVTIWL